MKWASLRVSGCKWTDTGQIEALSKALLVAVSSSHSYYAEVTI
jgi:hypothetical protein